jgi:7,8-dihydropterin-6-yl-methyl-4-(beta-D-ribofuranosyl)aminobenzene 5'-phosphate synthase
MRFVAFFDVHLDELGKFVETSGERTLEGEVEILFNPHTLAEPFKGTTGFVVFESEDMGETREYLTKFKLAGANVKLYPIFEDSELSKEIASFREMRKEADIQWRQSTFERLEDFGSTKTLEVLPLIDWYRSREDLEVETGVSYLVKTDENSILFDLGLNSKERHPSPLLLNMKRLGIALEDFETIVISHNHGDHVGGGKWAKNKTFSLTDVQIDLVEKKVYTPIPMTYPGLKPKHSKRPTVIAKGVATIGTISNPILLPEGVSLVQEQALAINLEGKGIVLIVGCGHQTLPKILKRTESLFKEPIYGLLGGLHLPFAGGPFEIMGMSPHKYFGTGKLPWQPITMDEVQGNIELLKERGPKVVGLSPHDSSEASIEAFRIAFPKAYRNIKVGESIIL